MGTVCVSASVETGRYTAETVKNDRITGYDRDIKDFRKGLADSASVGAQKGAEAFVTALDILSIVSGFNGIMGPKPPTAALAGADGEMIAVPEILEVDAGISILYSKSFPEGLFGEKKEVEEKEGVYVKNCSSKYKGQSYNGTRNPNGDFINGKGKSTLNKHANKHGYLSPEEYLRDVRNFLEKQPTSTTESFVSNEGTYFRYDTSTNEFGIVNEYGGISTYFEPEDGLTYWLEQIELYAPK